MSKKEVKVTKKVSLYNRWLNGIEAVGNKLPHPIALFGIFALAIIIISAICAAAGVSATGDLVSNGELQTTTVTAVSLLTKDGLAYIFSHAVSNFTSYAPLGMVLVAMLGVGVAEQSGMINALLKQTVKATPKSLITPVVVFLGVMSNIASDAGYVVLIPLGAMVFRAYGRHPMAGLAAAFAGVSGGFSANLLVGTTDPLLAGITQTAVVDIIDRVGLEAAGKLAVAKTDLCTGRRNGTCGKSRKNNSFHGYLRLEISITLSSSCCSLPGV